jgi:enamine deaminase RidA (YjgF/YER057c/UK114 family)
MNDVMRGRHRGGRHHGHGRGAMPMASEDLPELTQSPAATRRVHDRPSRWSRKLVYVGEQNGVDASGVVVGDGLESQIEQAYRNILELLRSVGATQENVVKQTILIAKGQDIRAGYAAAQKAWGAHPMAITVHIVDGFGIPGCARWN